MGFESMSFEDEPAEDLLDEARAKLKAPVARDRAWPAVVAAAFFAIAALGFAVASILAPPLGVEPAAKSSVR